MRDPHTRESRGFGFVKMVTSEQADAAKNGLNGEVYEGRTLSIEKARRSKPRTPTPGKYFGPPKRGESFGQQQPWTTAHIEQRTVHLVVVAATVIATMTADMADATITVVATALVTATAATVEAIVMMTADTVAEDATTMAAVTATTTQEALLTEMTVPTVGVRRDAEAAVVVATVTTVPHEVVPLTLTPSLLLLLLAEAAAPVVTLMTGMNAVKGTH